MTRGLLFLFSLFVITVVASSALWAQYSGGSGLSDDPWLIANAVDLILLGNSPDDYGDHFNLTANIDLAGQPYTRAVIAPDTNDSKPGHQGPVFTGRFNGMGHSISNLTITDDGSNRDCLALFGKTGGGGQVWSLTLTGVTIAGSDDSDFVAGLCADNEGEISCCQSSGSVTGNDYVGGMTGISQGSLTFASVEGNVSGCDSSQYVGGLCGLNTGDWIDGCQAIATVTAGDQSQYVGGLAGCNREADIFSSFAHSDVTGSSHIGGLVGYNEIGRIGACYCVGQVQGDIKTGGLCGQNYRGVVYCSYWDREVCDLEYSAGGWALTTAQMKQESSYLGWTSGTWGINEGVDYPMIDLINQPIDYEYPQTYPGDGQDEPFVLDSVDDLISFSRRPRDWNKQVALGADIDLTGVPFRPIDLFEGQFDGRGHTITGMTIDAAELGCNNNLGFFCVMYGAAVIKNTIFDQVTITVGDDAETIAGICAGNKGAIMNCNISGAITTGNESYYIGGIGGGSSGTIIDSFADVDITGNGNTYCVGGVIGANTGELINCHAEGAVSGSLLVGGLAGVSSGPVSNCYATGSVTGRAIVGGLCGKSISSITNCYATGTVLGEEGSVGGLCGQNAEETGVITSSYSNSNVTGGGNEIGGLCGANFNAITQCYATGSVEGYDYVGGFCGDNNGDITDCYASGSVNGFSDNATGYFCDKVGGFCGRNRFGSVINCYAAGPVSGSDYVAGFCAVTDGGPVLNCFWDKQVCNVFNADELGMGLNTRQMQTTASFTYAGWDFSDSDGDPADWLMPLYSYPRLVWEDMDINPQTPWRLLTPMQIARDQFAGCVIDNAIYVFGGNGNPDGMNLRSGEKYDIQTGTWSHIADNPHIEPGWGVEEICGVALNGKFYVFGAWGGIGDNGYYGVFNFNEMYDPATDTWTTLAQKPTTAASVTPAVYNGRIYLFGGYYEDEDPTGRRYDYTVVEAYDPDSNTWQYITNMPGLLVGPVIAVYENSAYIIGGYDPALGAISDKVSVYDFTTNTWTNDYCPTPAEARRVYPYSAPVPVINGRVILTGGVEGSEAAHWPSDRLTVFDIPSQTFTSKEPMPEPRDGHLVLTHNRDLYVLGGFIDEEEIDRTSNKVFIYDNLLDTSALNLPVVNMEAFADISRYWGMDACQPGQPCSQFDKNHDGRIDIYDLIMIASEWDTPIKITDHVFRVAIDSGIDYGRPDNDSDTSWDFYLAVNTDETVEKIYFQTPAGNEFGISPDYVSQSYPHGEFESERNWNDDTGQYEWEYEWDFFDPQYLNAYGDGWYRLTIIYQDGRSQQTAAWFGIPNSANPIPQAVQVPVMTNIEQGGVYSSPLTVAWQPVTDPAIELIHIGFENQTTDEWIEMLYPVDLTEMPTPQALLPGNWGVELGFGALYDSVNSDGIPLEVIKYTLSTYDIQIAPTDTVSDHVSQILIQTWKNFANPALAEDDHIGFEVEILTDDLINSIEILTPFGSTYTIPNQPVSSVPIPDGALERGREYDPDDDLYEWTFAIQFNPDYEPTVSTHGQYTLTLTYTDGRTAQTTAWYGVPDTSDPIPYPTQALLLTSFDNNAILNSPINLAWTPCTDENAIDIWINIDGIDHPYWDVWNFESTATALNEPVDLQDGNYELLLGYTIGYISTNPDGIRLLAGRYSETDYVFSIVP